MRVAIIGGGAAGLGAAWAISHTHDVTVFEADKRLGGHASTFSVERNGGAPIDVDTGFIVYNETNYPNLTALFRYLSVETKPVDMSVSVSGATLIEWSSDLKKMFSREGIANLDPKFLFLAKEILRFNSRARRDLKSNSVPDVSLEEYLSSMGGGRLLRDNYLIPVGAAIWSMPPDLVMAFPAVVFLNFFDNHSLLDIRRAKWRTVSGGSKRYVEKLANALKAEIILDDPVKLVQRKSGVVQISTNKTVSREFDHVVFACHSDEALQLLSEPTQAEYSILSRIPYARNTVVLHRDPLLMPRLKSHWASWNCIGSANTDGKLDLFTITYNMNRLQGIDPSFPLFVTLQPRTYPREECVIAEFDYRHPQYTRDAVKAQSRIASIQGQNRTTYAGAYLGTGFHEDAFGSGIGVADIIGTTAPLSLNWRQPPYICNSG